MKRFAMLLIGLLLTGATLADATQPKADNAGAKDSPLLGRFASAFIVSQDKRDFDELKRPLGPRNPIADKLRRDAPNSVSKSFVSRR